MGDKRYAALVGLFGISGALGAARTKLRRDETPNLPYDPDTTSYCTWWWDNDGSVACTDMPSVWGISMPDFLRWNPSITETCGNFLDDHSYCVEAFGEPEPTATTTTTAGPPGPTQPGQIDTCNRWDLVKDGDSCDTYTKKYPGVTLQNLVEWNSEIGDRCQFLWVDYYICTGVTGFEPTGTTTGPTPTSTNGIATPTPIQPGMVENCDAFHLVQAGDDCSTIASKYQITRAKFLEWNSGVGASCASLWLDYYVCVSIIGEDPSPTVTSGPTSTATNGVTTPTPIRPGMVDNCDDFHMVEEGDECGNIAHTYGISLAQLVKYNPEVKSDCSGLWLGYYVCVSIIGVDPTSTTKTTTTTTSNNGISTPTPTRPGMVGNCDAFYLVKSGDGCAAIASKHGISLSQLYKWNTEIGDDCGGLWPDYYICVSIVGVSPTSTTTTKGNGVATPTPTQTGMTGSCKTFRKVVNGDTCESIAKIAGVTLAKFYNWNTGLGSNCQSLWLGYYVCIAVL